MNKRTNVTAAFIGIAIFSGSVAAHTDKQSEDILHGPGKVESSRFTPYVHNDTAPKEARDYLFWNLHQIEHAGSFTPYVRVDNDRDNREDLLSNI
ncbi:MAG: hypothetical protein KDI83_14565 [Gammaproteobacteria bacterium]|nr:hypothetical protein [Gammaproteobacteria bacterium]